MHSAEDWAELLLPEIERQQRRGNEVVFRADAAFAKPEIYEALEERGVKYAIRIPANDSLERDIAELLTRPVGRPSHKPVVWYKGFLYQAASWKTARRVVAKVEFHFGELFPRVGFIVTNLETPSRAVVRFYNKQGTAEQWIKEGKQAVKITRLSCHPFRSNQVRLALSLLAYNPGEFVAAAGVTQANRELVADQLAAAAGEDRWTAGQTCALLLAEGHLTRRRFGAMLGRIALLPLQAGSRADGQGSRAESGYSGVGIRRRVAKVGHKWGNFGRAGVDGRPSGVLPMTNRFTVSRTGETGVLCLRFKNQKGNSGLIVKALRRLLYPCIESYSY